MDGDIKEFIGISATTISRKDEITDIEVYVPKFSPYVSEIKGNNPGGDEYEMEIEDIRRGKLRSSVYIVDTIQCVYFGSEAYSNIPDVHVGERVRVIQVSNTTIYYWLPIGIDQRLRRTEHKKISVMNEMKTDKQLTDDNTYYLDLDTRYNKHIHIHTGQSDGEQYGYDIKIDANEHTISINDTDNNSIVLNSELTSIKILNRDGTSVEAVKKNLIMSAPDSISMTAKNNISMVAGKTISQKSTNIDYNCDYFNQVSYKKSTSKGNYTTIHSDNIKIQGKDTSVLSNKLKLEGKDVVLYGVNLNVSGASGTGGSVQSHSKVVYP